MHRGAVDFPTLARDRCLHTAPQVALRQRGDKSSKLILSESKRCLEEALSNLQRIIDHQGRRTITLHSDARFLALQLFQIPRKHECQQHTLQAFESSCRGLSPCL